MPPYKRSFGTDGLSADEIDPDYLYFLRHVRPDPEFLGYVVKIPSKDGSSRPQVIRYAEPLAKPNAEPSAAKCDGGNRSAASSEEEDSSAADEVPYGAASPPSGPDGKARGRTAPPVERDELLSPSVDDDSRFFLQHSRLVNDSRWVREMGKVKEEVEDTIKNEDDKDSDRNEGMDTAGLDLQIVNDSESEMEIEEDEDDDEDEEKPLNVFITRTPESESSNRVASSRQGHSAMLCNASVKEEEGTVKNEDGSDNDKNEGMNTAGLDLQEVNVLDLETEMEVDDEEEEEPLNVHVTRIPELEPSNRKASSRLRHSAMLCNDSELEGVIWPSHIVERPESDFKQKLMKDLNRPFNREEYDELFAKATGRTPVMKERRTRRRVTEYPWQHEMGKSYFDNYPDLADQVEGESSNPNRLALLRGFFFWLQNIGHDEQFRPWSDDFKKYRLSFGLQPRKRRR